MRGIPCQRTMAPFCSILFEHGAGMAMGAGKDYLHACVFFQNIVPQMHQLARLFREGALNNQKRAFTGKLRQHPVDQGTL